MADKKKMTVPLRVFVPKQSEENPDDAGMLCHVFAYLKTLFDQGDEKSGKE